MKSLLILISFVLVITGCEDVRHEPITKQPNPYPSLIVRAYNVEIDPFISFSIIQDKLENNTCYIVRGHSWNEASVSCVKNALPAKE